MFLLESALDDEAGRRDAFLLLLGQLRRFRDFGPRILGKGRFAAVFGLFTALFLFRLVVVLPAELAILLFFRLAAAAVGR